VSEAALHPAPASPPPATLDLQHGGATVEAFARVQSLRALWSSNFQPNTGALMVALVDAAVIGASPQSTPPLSTGG